MLALRASCIITIKSFILRFASFLFLCVVAFFFIPGMCGGGGIIFYRKTFFSLLCSRSVQRGSQIGVLRILRTTRRAGMSEVRRKHYTTRRTLERRTTCWCGPCTLTQAPLATCSFNRLSLRLCGMTFHTKRLTRLWSVVSTVPQRNYVITMKSRCQQLITRCAPPSVCRRYLTLLGPSKRSLHGLRPA